MVYQRSQEAGSQEQSSGWFIFTKGIASRIALLLPLLGSWLLILAISSKGSPRVFCTTQMWKKDLFLHRNQLRNNFNIYNTNNTLINEGNVDIDHDKCPNRNDTRYKAISPGTHRHRGRQGYRIVMPPRASGKKTASPWEAVRYRSVFPRRRR